MTHDQTSLSLLERISDPTDPEAWQQMVEVYTPLLRQWLQRYSIQSSDADDLVQEVLLAASRDIHKFTDKQRPGAFRAWLRTILVHRLRDFWRRERRRPTAKGETAFLEQLQQLDDPRSAPSRQWDREHDQFVLQHLLGKSRARFSATTWSAFQQLVFDGQRAADVAERLGISVNAALIAKSRVLSHLRQQARGLTPF